MRDSHAPISRSGSRRYSEDIDLVHIRSESIGKTVDAIRRALSWLGPCRRKSAAHSIHRVFSFSPEAAPATEAAFFRSLGVEAFLMAERDPARSEPCDDSSAPRRPLLATVEDGDDLEAAASEPVGNHVRCAWHNQFTCASDSTRPAQIRQLGEAPDGIEQSLSDSTGGLGIVARDVRA